MRKTKLLAVALMVTGILVVVAYGWERRLSPVERGKYLVGALGCQDCHTPKVLGPGGCPVADTTRLLSGHPEGLPYPTRTPAELAQCNALMFAGRMHTAWTGPWGVSFAANLTPDTETGLGDWTEDMFVQTIRTGKHQGQPTGRDLLPPMPWANLTHGALAQPEADLKAIWAYLRSLPPIKNQVPPPVPRGQAKSPTAVRKNSVRNILEHLSRLM
jgi:hypothetical protein